MNVWRLTLRDDPVDTSAATAIAERLGPERLAGPVVHYEAAA